MWKQMNALLVLSAFMLFSCISTENIQTNFTHDVMLSTESSYSSDVHPGCRLSEISSSLDDEVSCDESGRNNLSPAVLSRVLHANFIRVLALQNNGRTYEDYDIDKYREALCTPAVIYSCEWRAVDLSPDIRTMKLMRFPVTLTEWRFHNEEAVYRRTDH